jgi:PAS domain S-box-containing protein
MRRRSRVGSVKLRRRKTAAKRVSRVKATRPLNSGAARQKLSVALLRRQLSQARQEQIATADVLRVISSSSTGELEPIFAAILENAVRLSEAKFGTLHLYESGGYRLMAMHNAPPAYAQALLERDKPDPIYRPSALTALGRAIATKRTVHVVDYSKDAAYLARHPGPVRLVELGGGRTVIVVPICKEDQFVGIIVIYRQEVRPFTDKQIELVENFAAEAVIAVKDARLLNELRQTLEYHRRTEAALADSERQIRKAHDELEMKVAERTADLSRSEARFRDFAETASDWLWEIDPYYKFTLLTENAFGSDRADRIGKTCWDDALDLESEPGKWRVIWETLGSRKPFRDFVYRSMADNGSSMYVRVSANPVFDVDGEFRGYRGTGSDVTALMRAQEEHERLRQLESDLAHTNRLSMMGELAASLAHEIAQPVATARNNARAAMHFLDRSAPDLGQVGEALACVVVDADRAGEILDRIRDHIKKAPPRKERVDLNQAITDVIALAQGAIVKDGVSVQTHLTEGLSDVLADCVQLQQVVLNLILNAVEAMSSVKKGARELSISTEQHQAGGVLVTMRDSGPGIDPEHLDRVFDAFYTTKSSGVGMGLSICRSIIDAHGGRLWADVDSCGGAVFLFTLPSAEKELTNPRPADHHIEAPNRGTASDVPR